jgi:hypothetical protein
MTSFLEAEETGVDKNVLYNRFVGLTVDDDLDEDDLVQNDQTQQLPKHPSIDNISDQLTIEYFMSGNDQFKVFLFLLALDELMSHNAKSFSNLKDLSIVL